MTIVEYIGKMNFLGYEMAAAGRLLDDGELVEYIHTGLDMDFSAVVTGVVARMEPITVQKLYG